MHELALAAAYGETIDTRYPVLSAELPGDKWLQLPLLTIASES
jgi:hypothetical protein